MSQREDNARSLVLERCNYMDNGRFTPPRGKHSNFFREAHHRFALEVIRTELVFLSLHQPTT